MKTIARLCVVVIIISSCCCIIGLWRINKLTEANCISQAVEIKGLRQQIKTKDGIINSLEKWQLSQCDNDSQKINAMKPSVGK